MKRLLITLGLLLGTIAQATPGNFTTLRADSLEGSYATQNIVPNSGFEVGGLLNWAATGGTATIETATANVARGNFSLKYTPSGTESFYSTSLIPIPAGLYGVAARAECNFRSGAVLGDVQIQARSLSAIIASADVAITTPYSRTGVNFTLPTSGAVRLTVRGVAPVATYVDDCYITAATSSSGSSGGLVGARITESGSTCSVNRQNPAGLISSCVYVTGGIFTINLNSGFFTSAPTCVCSADPTGATSSNCSMNDNGSFTSTQIKVAVTGAGALIDEPFTFLCMPGIP